jgi:hypothetical protein
VTNSLDDAITDDQWTRGAFFWVGLFGIVATGAMVGAGGDNYWALGHPFDNAVDQRAAAILGVVIFLVGLCDLVAFGVIFAGAVILVQRFRGVASQD